jgi:hypothetical protein
MALAVSAANLGRRPSRSPSPGQRPGGMMRGLAGWSGQRPDGSAEWLARWAEAMKRLARPLPRAMPWAGRTKALSGRIHYRIDGAKTDPQTLRLAVGLLGSPPRSPLPANRLAVPGRGENVLG